MAVCAPVEKVPLLLQAFFFLLSLPLSVSYPHHHRHALIYTHTRAQTLQLPHTNTLRPGFQCQVTFQIPEKCRDT